MHTAHSILLSRGPWPTTWDKSPPHFRRMCIIPFVTTRSDQTMPRTVRSRCRGLVVPGSTCHVNEKMES